MLCTLDSFCLSYLCIYFPHMDVWTCELGLHLAMGTTWLMFSVSAWFKLFSQAASMWRQSSDAFSLRIRPDQYAHACTHNPSERTNTEASKGSTKLFISLCLHAHVYYCVYYCSHILCLRLH